MCMKGDGLNTESKKIILQGTWLYDGSVKLKIEITETNFKPGSGDFLDPDDVRKDQAGVYYNIRCFSHEGKLASEIVGCETLEEAKEIVNKNCESLVWL